MDCGPRYGKRQRCVLAQDAHGRLFGLDEGENKVDPVWLARVLERPEPKPQS
jgi:hypothetical protein